jgi:hypothetical protein
VAGSCHGGSVTGAYQFIHEFGSVPFDTWVLEWYRIFNCFCCLFISRCSYCHFFHHHHHHIKF